MHSCLKIFVAMIYPSVENLTKTNNLGAVLAIIGPKQPLAILNPPCHTSPPDRLGGKKETKTRLREKAGCL